MLKNARRLIKRTELWLHRSVGRTQLRFEKYRGSEIKRIRLCGASAFDSKTFKQTAALTSSDNDSEHFLDLRLGSRNLLNYNVIADAMKEKITGPKFSTSGNTITMTTPASSEFMAPLIEEDFVKFKSNQVYTFAAQISYQSGTGDKPTGFCFIYTDGTHEEIRINAKKTMYNPLVAVSRAGKTLSSIGIIKPVGASRIYYYKTKFGVYEGDLGDESSIEEAYTEPQHARIPLDAPLRAIYGASDILDITEGVYQRNVEYLFFDSSAPFEMTETPHVFLTRLPSKMRDDLIYECPYGDADEDGALSDYEWVSIGDERETMLLYLPDCLTLDEVESHLSANPFGFIYAMQDTEKKYFSVSFDDTDDPVFLSLDVKFEPYLFYAEYI
jgi:hypothetical protein